MLGSAEMSTMVNERIGEAPETFNVTKLERIWQQ
jgi:hypothetical protein